MCNKIGYRSLTELIRNLWLSCVGDEILEENLNFFKLGVAYSGALKLIVTAKPFEKH